MKLFVATLLLFCGCQSHNNWRWQMFTEDGKRDRKLYQMMQLENRAMVLEYGNLTNVNALQNMIDVHGMERSKLEGRWK